MISVYDTITGHDYYTLHYSYSDIPSIACEHAPLEVDEARKLYKDYVRDTRYAHVYVTKDNLDNGTSIQLRGDF